jgi:hypothetical protein
MMHDQKKSDLSIVAVKSANKDGQPSAESMERRERAEGNAGENRTRRTPSRENVFQGLDRVRQAAKERKKERFTALLHHVDVELLGAAFSWLKRDAAPGISDKHIQMARELGMNPKKFGSLANHKQEKWKAPLPEFIEELYIRRFRKERPVV